MVKKQSESILKYQAIMNESIDFMGKMMSLIDELKRQGVTNKEVLGAIEEVPREHFTPLAYREQAQENIALPLSCGQTISQPFIVAYMTQQLMPVLGKKILEVGTGSGYQAAILSYLGADVYSIERIHELAQNARQQLNLLGLDKIHLKEGDGSLGWCAHSPYDAVIVTAASQEGIPQALVGQLRIGGKMIIPIFEASTQQEYLYLLTKKTDTEIDLQKLIPVRFVPLIITGDS